MNASGEVCVYHDMPEQACILLAEDYEGLRRFMTTILVAEGYRVLPAENGRAALALFQVHRGSIKMLITDLAMPEMSGTELIAEVRKVSPALPILVCSSSIRLGERFYTEDIRCIEKPFPLAAFESTVAEMWQSAPAPGRQVRHRRALPRPAERSPVSFAASM